MFLSSESHLSLIANRSSLSTSSRGIPFAYPRVLDEMVPSHRLIRIQKRPGKIRLCEGKGKYVANSFS
jgi:hypothetical protein